jgi:hypothetical protein
MSADDAVVVHHKGVQSQPGPSGARRPGHLAVVHDPGQVTGTLTGSCRARDDRIPLSRAQLAIARNRETAESRLGLTS